MKKVLLNPWFHIYTTTIGLLIFVQALHTSYHHTMDTDPDGYCVQVERQRNRSK